MFRSSATSKTFKNETGITERVVIQVVVVEVENGQIGERNENTE
jgi:hypothetical protein